MLSFPQSDDFVIIKDWNSKGNRVGQATCYSWQVGTLGFIKKDFEGTIPAGTPFIQIIPVKNESWEMNLKTYTEEEIEENDHLDFKIYNPDDPNKSNYKKSFWVKKQYE